MPKPANDNLVSETAALRTAREADAKAREAEGIAYNGAIEGLRAELRAAKENVEELRHKLRDLKNGAGFRRTGTR